jgi:tripartite-type tricarboxylate transporter receptor subunit TctC
LTVFSADPGSMVNAIGLFRRLPLRPRRDFRGVGLFCDFPLAVAVRRDSRYTSLAQYVEAAKRGDGAVACGTPGNGSPHHLALENFQRTAGIKLNIIPYRGGAPGMNDILAGNLESMMLDIGTAGGAFRSGDIRALALTMPERWRWLSQVPLVKDTYPDYRAAVWQGLVVPAATPDPSSRASPTPSPASWRTTRFASASSTSASNR